MSILVTGATGFIGREVVQRLLATQRSVLVLARASDSVPAIERVVAALGDVPRGGVLDVLEGDLAAPDCGLEPAGWRRLRATIETVIHCAGDTRFEPNAMGPYVAGHVHGPLRLLEGLARGRLARWAHLSTAFVCGRRSGTILERESDVGQAFHNTYERIKLEAERAIRAAGAEWRVDVRVFRPSIVVGAAPATAGGTPSNLFFDFIRVLAALAALPDGARPRLRVPATPHARFNIVPVDHVARALVALAERRDCAGQTLHLVVRDAPTQAAMLRMITERLGVHGIRLVDTHREPLDEASPSERAVAQMLEPYRAYLTQDVRFDDATAARLLARCGIERPRLTPAVGHHLIDQALGAAAPQREALPQGTD